MSVPESAIATASGGPEATLHAVRQIAREIAARHAGEVDAQARFPTETLAALKAARVLSAPLPPEQGGAGLGLRQQGDAVAALAEACASSAMVLAMHYSQLACAMRHGVNPALKTFLRDLAAQQWLLASITSEVGTAGDTRRSVCAVERHGDDFVLQKSGTTGSYCQQADAMLVTARVGPDAAPNDQVLVLVRRDQYALTQTTPWDTLGMRGTCSPGVALRARAPVSQILPVPFAEISAVSMVPHAHILWSAVWTGIAAGAFGKAAAFIRGQAGKSPGVVPPGAARLAAMSVGLQSMRDGWRAAAIDFDAMVAQARDRAECTSLRWALRMNNLKIASAEAAPRLVHEALQTIGVAAYRNDGPFSLGRAYRDALSGALMVSNDRIGAASASMLLVYKEA